MIIGFSGYAKSGKNAVADMAQRFFPEKNFEIVGFATALKQIASILTGLPASSFEDQKVKKSVMLPIWNWISQFDNDTQTIVRGIVLPGMEDRAKQYTYREFLQRVGTDAMRNNIHTDVWVNALMSKYDNAYLPFDNDTPNWLIQDVRFPNEAAAIKQRGGVVIRIRRQGCKPVNAHPSETALDGYAFDYAINNDGTLQDLELKVFATLNKII